jgi:hypothetical protein
VLAGELYAKRNNLPYPIPDRTSSPSTSWHTHNVGKPPIEQVWGSLKPKELANLCTDSFDEVDEVAVGRLGPHRQRPRALLRLRDSNSATLPLWVWL